MLLLKFFVFMLFVMNIVLMLFIDLNVFFCVFLNNVVFILFFMFWVIVNVYVWVKFLDCWFKKFMWYCINFVFLGKFVLICEGIL